MTDQTDITLANGPRLETVFITPEMALEFLSNNTLNRKVRLDHVKELARDITNNHWDLNGETLKIAANGDILDGQHRLQAILIAGKGAWFVLVSNLPEGSRYTIDSGLRRTPADHLRLQGETSAGNLAPLLSTVWQYINGRNFSNHNRPTQRDRQALLVQHPELRRSAEIGYRTYLGYRPFNRTAVGVAHFAINQVDSEISPEFFARLEDGASMETGHPIMTLRKRVMADREGNLRFSMPDQIGYVLYTWNHWLDYLEAGKKLYRIQYPLGTDLPNINKPRQTRQEELNAG